MNYGNALQLIGGLSKPSKMPWWSWSISAERCITGAKLAQNEGTVCSGCYALKGNYIWDNVKSAQERRLRGMESPDFVEAFALVLTQLHSKTRKRRDDGRTENRFRWLDAGDLQSVEMLEKINKIAALTPQIDHWLPTREVGIVNTFLEQGNEFAPNLVVRISATLVGELPKKRFAGLPVATVGCEEAPEAHNCRALVEQGNRCLDCDRCWRVEADINYPLH